MYRLFLFALCTTILFTTCQKTPHCTWTIQCDAVGFFPVFINYDSTERDSIILFSYKKDGTFSSPTGQRVFAANDSVLNYDYNYGGPLYYKYVGLGIPHDADYMIYVPRTNDSFKFYNITDSQSTQVADCNYHRGCTTYSSVTVSGGNNKVLNGDIHITYILLYK